MDGDTGFPFRHPQTGQEPIVTGKTYLCGEINALVRIRGQHSNDIDAILRLLEIQASVLSFRLTKE